jgi:hypothetical protein
MGDDESINWPSPLPPCPVAASIVTAMKIAIAHQIDELWKQTVVDGFEFKKIDWTPTKPTHRKNGPEPTAMNPEPLEPT